MRFIRRPKKKYGNVKGRGIHPAKLHVIRTIAAKREEKNSQRLYRIPSGVPCQIRKRGSEAWIDHVTAKKQVLPAVADHPGYLIFTQDNWQMRIAGARVRRHK